MKTFILGCCILCFTTGCAQLIGIKSYESAAGTKIHFTSGIDFGASVNQIDTVENSRGIKPAQPSSAN